MKNRTKKPAKGNSRKPGLRARNPLALKKIKKEEAERSQDKFDFTEEIQKTRGVLFKLSKWFLYLFICFNTLVVIGLVVVHFVVTPGFIKTQSRAIVADVLASELKMGVVSFDVLSGLSIEDFEFYPTRSKDSPFSDEPLLRIDRLKVDYNLLALLKIEARVNTVVLENPQVNFEIIDERNSLSELLDGLSSPKEQVEAKTEESDETKETGPIYIEIPFSPSSVFLPFFVSVSDIGFQNFAAQVLIKKGGDENQLSLSGLDANFGVEWNGFDSLITTVIKSRDKGVIDVNIRDKGFDKIALQTEMMAKVEIEDLTSLKILFENRIAKLSFGQKNLTGVPSKFKLALSLKEELDGINIEELSLALADIVSFDLSGDLRFPQKKNPNAYIKIISDGKIELDSLPRLASPFINMDASGELNLTSLLIDGEVSQDFSDPMRWQPPKIMISGNVRDAAIKVPQFNVGIGPIGGKSDLSVVPDPANQETIIDLVSDHKIPDVSFRQVDSEGKSTLDLAVKDFTSYVLLRTKFPSLVTPIFKADIDVGRLILQAGEARIDSPISAESSANGDGKLAKLNVRGEMEMGELVNADFSFGCREKCVRNSLKANFEVEELKNLYQIASPLIASKVPAQFLPAFLEGGIRGGMKVSVNLAKSPLTGAVAIGDMKKVEYEVTGALLDLSTKIPFMGVGLENAESKMELAGGLFHQKLKLGFGARRVGLEQIEMGAEIKRFALLGPSGEIDVSNQIQNLSDLSRLAENMRTEIGLETNIGKVDSDIPYSTVVDSTRTQLSIRAENFRNIAIEQLGVTSPEVGFDFEASGEAILSKEMKPTHLDTKYRFSLAPSSRSGLPDGLGIVGKLKGDMKLVLSKLDDLGVDGKLAFENFGVEFASESGETLAVVEKMEGNLPFSQQINLTRLLEKVSAVTGEAPVPKESRDRYQNTLAAYVEKANVNRDVVDTFAVIDYPGMSSFRQDSNPLYIKRIGVMGLNFTDVEIDAQIRQDWLAINKFQTRFLGGRIQSDLQIHFDPLPKSIKLSSHVTRLNTHDLIKNFPQLQNKKGITVLGANPYIDSSVHVGYDFITRDLNGNMEITSIGKEQMKMILYFLDPDQKNKTLSDIRTALNFGDVRLVSIPIESGEIGMDVDVRALGVPIPLPKLKRFPISNIINNATASM